MSILNNHPFLVKLGNGIYYRDSTQHSISHEDIITLYDSDEFEYFKEFLINTLTQLYISGNQSHADYYTTLITTHQLLGFQSMTEMNHVIIRRR